MLTGNKSGSRSLQKVAAAFDYSDGAPESMTRLKRSLEQRGLLPGKTAVKRASLTDEFILRAVSSVLPDYYSAAENIFKEVAKVLDGRLPSGTERHRDLLKQMKLQINGLRPAVLSKTTFQMFKLNAISLPYAGKYAIII